MKTKEVTLYKFDELSVEAQAKAIENEQESRSNQLWSIEGLIEQAMQEILKDKIGSPVLKVGYSLGYSQGDGANFTGTIERSDYLVNKLPAGVETLEISRNDRHHSHENTMSFTYFNSEGDEIDVPEEDKEHYRAIARELKKIGYSIIEDETSEGYAKENLENSEELFLESGLSAPSYLQD